MDGNKFCANCGNDLKAENKFCPKCGADVKPAPASESLKKTEAPVENFTEKVAKNNPIPGFLKKAKSFIFSHKKQFIIGGSVVGILIVGLVLFNILWDFTKIEWDKEYSDVAVNMTASRRVTLNVKAEDREKNKISEIEFSGDGEFEVDGTKVIWTMPKKTGTYKIYAKAPSGKTIEKTIEYVSVDADSKILNGVISEEIDDKTTDNDGDGIMNAEEKELGTNPNLADTDMDGILDSQELDGTNTDPLKADTDDDGLLDGDEIALGLDPNKADSKGDGVKDSERSLSYKIEENDVNLTINGKGNIASSSVNVIKNSNFSEIEGISDEIYQFSTQGTLEKADVTIKYNGAELRKNNVSERDLTLYRFDDENKTLEKVESKVDANANILTATLNHFSKYVLGNSSVEVSALSAQVMFVIDNSVSMYTESQILGAGYDSVTGADGNDSNFRRLTLTNNMIDKLTGSYKFGVAEFSGNYVNLQKFVDDKNSAKNAVNSMKLKWNSNASGTNISTAMTRGISEFSGTDKNGHYMILLTDGQDTSDNFSAAKKSIITAAQEKNVKICTIGLGDKIDTEILNEISEATGCDYYNADDSGALDEIYAVISADINFGYVDTDDDNTTDGMISADSGFIPTRDGFSFGNYGTELSDGGHCYGMALFAMLRFQGKLPSSLDYRNNQVLWVSLKADGYNLKTDSYFRSSKNLYNFRFTTPGLKLYFQDDERPADYRDRVEDDTWKIKKDYVSDLEDSGASIKVKEVGYTYHDDASGKDFTKYESATLNENETISEKVKRDESDLLKAIWRLFIVQKGNDKRTHFESDPDKAWSELNSELEAGQPTLLVINSNHAINATKIIQDNSDSNKFKIGVYNNNFPGETQYITVTRTKTKATINPTKWILNLSNSYTYAFEYDSDGDGEVEKTTVSLANPVVE